MENSLERFTPKNARHLAKGLKSNAITKVARGIYAKSADYSLFDVYALRYQSAIFTLKTALSFYGMTDYHLEEPFYLATKYGSRPIADPNIRQFMIGPSFFDLGKASLKHGPYRVQIYDRERLLIEVLRFESKFGAEYYKTAIIAYRKFVQGSSFSFPRFEEYCSHFANGKNLIERFRKEIL